MTRALVTGITGQDGSYLSEFLISMGYEVHGLVRPSSNGNLSRLQKIETHLHLHTGDVTDFASVLEVVRKVCPDEVYHLAGMSQVRWSFDEPLAAMQMTGIGTVNMLQAVQCTVPAARYYQASSSEIFGNSPAPQNEFTRLDPQSPYAVAKAAGYWFTRNYRIGYELQASNGILFNHESPRRGEMFVSRKITKAVAAIKAGRQTKLYLGNLNARRDWGYAPEFVRAMWLMMQQDRADDFVIGTGETHTVREFVEEAFACADMDWKEYTYTDPTLYRPNEVNYLQADIDKARLKLGWEPEVTFHELVRLMVEADIKDEHI